MSAGPEEIAKAVTALRRGRLVAFPTETVYGLGADATDGVAVEAVFALKGRPATNPLIVHVSGESMAREVCAEWPEEASRLARAFWPGPLTLVLPKAEHVPDIVTAGGETVAVRMPAHAVTLSLIEAFGRPIVGPSANPSGSVSPTRAEHVAAGFGSRAPIILDGGSCARGIESTVLDLTGLNGGGEPAVLRPGVIGAAEISAVLGRPVVAGRAGLGSSGGVKSPGTAGPHYRPASPLVVVSDVELGGLSGESVAIVRAGAPACGCERIELPADASGFAAGLYAAVREADGRGPAQIAVQAPPEDSNSSSDSADGPDDEPGADLDADPDVDPDVNPDPEGAIWHAVRERLRRAAGG